MRLAAQLVLMATLAASSVFPMDGQPVTATTAAPVVNSAEVTFQFERAGLAVPRFTLRVQEDGTGSYQADQVYIPSTKAAMRVEGEKHIDRALTLNPATVAKIFKTARGLNRFNTACASKAKNIADTGTKTLSYAGADGRGSCVYNYSENKNVTMLTDTFQSIAFTMDEGRKLEFLHRYDRLGLDAEMITMAQQVDSGRALELGTIVPILAAIEADTALMQRVRLRAAKMLEQASDNVADSAKDK